MLDDLKYIHEKDPQDALGVVEKQPIQLKHRYNLSPQFSAPINNVVLAGMGGSAWPGLFVQTWPGLNVPFEIVRNYTLPRYVGENSLVIASSYSGNTEEDLAMLNEAEQRKANVAVMSHGGRLAELAQQSNHLFYELPEVSQPRMSCFYFWAAFLQLLEPLGLIDKGSQEQMDDAADWLIQHIAGWGPTVPTKSNQAKQIAQELMGKSIVVYSGPLLYPAAYKWKIGFNENSKNLAWVNQYPEFDHNEFIGWTGQPTQKPFAVIEIRSNLEHQRVQRRFEVSERLLSGQRPSPIVVKPAGDNIIKQLIWAAALGDFVSVYLALLNGINPTPVDLVEKLKKALG